MFKSPSSVNAFQVLTDAHLGGLSTASISHTDQGEGAMVFHGNYNSDVPPDAHARVHKLGQASVVSKARILVYTLWKPQ